MEIQIEKIDSATPVAILAVQGELDASNYLDLVALAEQANRDGYRDLLIDLGNTTFLSSSGLVALHSIALILRGDTPHNPDSGWRAIHAMEDDTENGLQEHIKLLNPQPRVLRTLTGTGMDNFFAIFTDRNEALASFQSEGARLT